MGVNMCVAACVCVSESVCVCEVGHVCVCQCEFASVCVHHQLQGHQGLGEWGEGETLFYSQELHFYPKHSKIMYCQTQNFQSSQKMQSV